MATAARKLPPTSPKWQDDNIPVLGEKIEVSDPGTRLVVFPSLQQRLYTLNQMVNTGKAITVVIGDYGSGKTLLSHYCRTELWQDKKQIHLSAQAGLPMTQLARQLTRALGIHGQGTITFPRIARLLQNNAAHLNHVLIIDDANNLTRDVLLGLLRLKQTLVDKGADFNIVLLAEPEIKHSLVHESLEDYSDGWAGYVYLPRLGERDMEDYVRQRSELVGNRKALPATEQLRDIHGQAGGLPLKVNELLDKFWLAGSPAAVTNSGRGRLYSGIAATVLALFLMTCFLWPRQLDQLLARLF